MATGNQMSDDELAFSQAFNEGEDAPQGAPAEQPAEQPPEQSAESVQAAVDEATPPEPQPEAPPADALVLDTETSPEEEEPTDPKDVQRSKSWEGRLRAREAELAAREKALAERERAAPVADEEDEPESTPEERVEEVTEAVQDGSMTADEAIAALSSDFGPEFAKTITSLVRAAAQDVVEQSAGSRIKALDERLSQSTDTVASMIAALSDDRQRRHFETIADAHPDFAEVAEGEMMKSYLDSLNQADRQQADQVIAVGSARDIVKLLDAVKASAKKPEPDVVVEAAADDAEGVRSRGLRLPEEPKPADGYEDAWNQF